MSLRPITADLLPQPMPSIAHGVHGCSDGRPHVGDRQGALRLTLDGQRQGGARLPESVSEVSVIERRGADGHSECLPLRDGLGAIKSAQVHTRRNLHHTVYLCNTVSGLHHMVKACFDADMEIQDLRRKRLRDWIADATGGNVAAFAEELKKSPSQLNDMLAGRKPFGEKVARDLERRGHKPNEWLDHEHAAVEDAAVYPVGRDAALLRSAILVTERAFAAKHVSVTPEARAEITLAAYDMLKEGQDMQSAERIVARMLQAVGGATSVTS